MRKSLSILFGFIFILVSATVTPATVLIPKNFKDLTREADIVFIGTVTDINCEWSDPEQNSIYTYVTFSDLEIIAGEYNENSITVRLSGGEIDNIKVEYAAVPKFKVGERNLIFLKGNFIQLCPIVGWVQGRFHVIYDQSIHDEIVLTDDLKPVGEIQNSRIITSRDPDQEVKGSPGIPDTPEARVIAIQGSNKKMSVHSFIEAVRNLRNTLKAEGKTLGYSPSVSLHSGIPVDSLNPSIEKAPKKDKVTGYDEVPQPVVLPSPGPDEQ